MGRGGSGCDEGGREGRGYLMMSLYNVCTAHAAHESIADAQQHTGSGFCCSSRNTKTVVSDIASHLVTCKLQTLPRCHWFVCSDANLRGASKKTQAAGAQARCMRRAAIMSILAKFARKSPDLIALMLLSDKDT